MKEANQQDMGPYRDTPCQGWRPPASPFAVESSSAVLVQLRHEAEAGLYAPRGEHEIGGVLFGVNEPDCVRIVASRPLMCEHTMGPGFVLSEKDEKHLAQLISAPATDSELAGLKALGWYHSHIASPIFLSERDLEIHSRHFREPFHIALVIRLSSERQPRAGFFFRELSGAMRTDSSYEEFTIQTSPPRTIAPSPSPLDGSPGGPVAALETPPHRPLACPRCGSNRIRRSHRSKAFERLANLFGYYPFRCQECLSRPFLKTVDLRERIHHTSHKRQAERRRAWLRTRREILLWSGGILGFLLILFYLVRDTGPKPDEP